MCLRAGEAARAAGVNQQTLRYHERRGLLPAPEHGPGGHPLYDDQTVTTLRVIKAAQRLGFTLHEVADLIEAGRRRDAGLQVRAREELAEVEERIADLDLIRENLRAARGMRRPAPVRQQRLLPDPLRVLADVRVSSRATATGHAGT